MQLFVFLPATFIALSLVSGCNQQGGTSNLENSDNSFMGTNSYAKEFLIVSNEHSEEFLSAFGVENSGTWFPSEEQVQKLLRDLIGFLKKEAPKQSPDLWEKGSVYKVQFVGFISGDDKKIFCNLFCDTFNQDWRKNPIVVDDGGDCYFQVIYNLKKRTFSDLYINGEA